MEKKNVVGILCALGGSGLISDAIQVLIYMNKLANDLSLSFDLSFGDIGLNANFFYINFAITLVYGVIAVILGTLTVLDKKYSKYPLFIVGIFAVVSFFKVIRPRQVFEISPSISVIIHAIHLSTNLNTLNPFILLLGGIFAIAIKEIKSSTN